MRSETQPYSTVIAIRLCWLCRTAHAIFFPKFWNDKTNFTRVFVTVSPRRPWDLGPRLGVHSSFYYYVWEPQGNHDNKVYIFKMASYRSDRRNPLLSLEQMLAEKTTLRTQKLTHRNIICKLPFITLCCVVNVYFYSRVHSV